jgi:hypothetical protein
VWPARAIVSAGVNVNQLADGNRRQPDPGSNSTRGPLAGGADVVRLTLAGSPATYSGSDSMIVVAAVSRDVRPAGTLLPPGAVDVCDGRRHHAGVRPAGHAVSVMDTY